MRRDATARLDFPVSGRGNAKDLAHEPFPFLWRRGPSLYDLPRESQDMIVRHRTPSVRQDGIGTSLLHECPRSRVVASPG
jgi:hypothetical protein